MNEYQWKTVSVVGFDELMRALDYADRKGFMPDAIKEEWEAFNWKPEQPAQQEPVGYLYEGIAYHTQGKKQFAEKQPSRLEQRWWRLVGPVYTFPPTQQHECSRSHPHENMDAMCELRTEIARLTNENARLKAAQQEPWVCECKANSRQTCKCAFKAQQEPFGHVTVRRLSQRFENHADQYHFYPAGQSPYLDNVDELHAVYTRPQSMTPLTDEQITQCYETTGHYQSLRPQDRFAVFALARAIEAAHGIGEKK